MRWSYRVWISNWATRGGLKTSLHRRRTFISLKGRVCTWKVAPFTLETQLFLIIYASSAPRNAVKKAVCSNFEGTERSVSTECNETWEEKIIIMTKKEKRPIKKKNFCHLSREWSDWKNLRFLGKVLPSWWADYSANERNYDLETQGQFFSPSNRRCTIY